MTRCANCGNEVPDGTFCVRCGNPLAGGSRGFAAAPHERTAVPTIIPTLFPHLPRADLGTFRIALGLGLGVVAVLAVAGFYPIAVGVSAAVVPVLTWLYLDDVDVYEEEPLWLAGVMAASGAIGGVVAGLLAQAVSPSAGTLSEIESSDALFRGIVVPTIAMVVGSIAPLAYLAARRFNDVLDGVSFGAVAGASMSGALLLSSSTHLLSSGLRPVGAVGPWIADLAQMALLLPVVFASALGGALAAIWLRLRAPERDRHRLGHLGNPVIAVALAFALVWAASLARLYLGVYLSLLLVLVIALAGIVWLRFTIHLGLSQEAAEIDLGHTIVCPNCGARTQQHSFCSSCGVSLRALPKATHSHEIPIIPPPATTRP
jgi:ribosomal protein L32